MAVASARPTTGGERWPGCAAPSPGSGQAAGPEADYERLFLEHLDYIERVIAFIVRRHALRHLDAQDFEGWVKLRLVQRDYAVLRKFRGRSKLTTFLTTVIHNLYRDFRIRQWGKWRPSAAARRLGEVGEQLEALLYRDRYSLAEAAAALRENYDLDRTTGEIEELAAQLRPRFSRRFESERALVHAVSPERTEENLLAHEQSVLWSRVHSQVRKEIRCLGSEDRLILRMRFEEGLTVAAIARELDLDQRRLYARVHRLLREIRRRVEAGGPAGAGFLAAPA